MKTPPSISHFTGREQQALLRLKNAIVERYRPLLLYFIGSSGSLVTTRNCFARPKAREQWCYSCDLLMVLPDEAPHQVVTKEELKSIGPEYSAIHLIAHPLHFVVEQLLACSLFFCWIQRRAILLYERDNTTRKLPQPVHNMKQYEAQAAEFFTANPHYENYRQVRLSPLPQKENSPESGAPAAETKMSPALQRAMADYLEYHAPRRVSINIRTVLLDYIQSSTVGFPLNFKDILWDFTELMEFFDGAAAEAKGSE